MSEYDNTNSGVLFKNQEKVELKKPNWPDYQGSINVKGEEFWLSAWIKKSKDSNKTFMSLAVKPKDGNQANSQQGQPAQQAPAQQDNFDDEIPF